MTETEQLVRTCLEESSSRFDFWVRFISSLRLRAIAEIGVYKGEFAKTLLSECSSIDKYYMIDPWRHLENWNKPANKADEMFERFLAETRANTEFAAGKRSILRGTTTEVIDGIPDSSLDLAYIDGDHTLRGITIDLVRILPKIREGGWVAGDDFADSIWQHATSFEPTLVFPFAVYFAEAANSRIYGLPNAQFLIEKNSKVPFVFVDHTGRYGETALRAQFHPATVLRLKVKEMLSWPSSVLRAAKKLRR